MEHNSQVICASQSMTYGEKYALCAHEYQDVPITEIPLSVRMINGFKTANISTIGELIDKTPEEIASIKNVGAKCLKEIEVYFVSNYLNSEYQNNSFQKRTKVFNYSDESKKIFKENIEFVLLGDFSIFNNLSFEEKEILEKLQEGQDIIDFDLLENVVFHTEKIIPIVDMLNSYIRTSYQDISYFNQSKDLLRLLPNSIKQVPLQYILKLNLSNQIFENINTDSKTISLGDYVYNCANIEQSHFLELSKLLKSLDFDIQKNIDKLFNQLSKNNKYGIVMQMRSSGKTLEEVGGKLNVTRERVRQLESKVKRTFSHWNKENKLLSKISLLLDGDNVLSPKEIRPFLGENSDIILWLLKVASLNFTYDRNLDLFLLDKDESICSANNFLDYLPELFHVSELNAFFNYAQLNYNLPLEIASKVIKTNYSVSGKMYHRYNLSFVNIYKYVLNEFYEDGLHIHNADSIQKFRGNVCNLFGDIDLPKNNRAISARLADIAMLCGRGIYKPIKEDLLSTFLINEIRDYIVNCEMAVVLINIVFNNFENALIEHGIDNKYFLQGILKFIFKDEFEFTRDYILKDKNITNISSEIIKFIKESPYLVSKAEIKKQFPGITEILISFAVEDTYILNYFGEYLHSSKLSISSDEKQYLKEKIKDLVADNKLHKSLEILNTLTLEMPEILNRNGIKSQFSLYSVLEYLFSDLFQFDRPYISNFDVKVERPGEVLRNLIYSEDEYYVSDIRSFAQENDYQINSMLEYLSKCNDKYLIYDRTRIISFEGLGIDNLVAKQVEDILYSYITKTIPIRDLTCFSFLPTISMPWSQWLIYSVINKWGNKLEVSVTSNKIASSVPLISLRGQMETAQFADIEVIEQEKINDFSIIDDLDDIESWLLENIEDDMWKEELDEF